jgi:hypothetical protein
MKLKYLILCIIFFTFSCRHKSISDQIDSICHTGNRMNLSIFKNWEISNNNGSRKTVFHYLDPKKVDFSFIAYKEGNRILIRKTSPVMDERFQNMTDFRDEEFSSLDIKNIVEGFLALNIDELIYSEPLNGIILSRDRLTIAYLFPPFISATKYKSWGYEKIDEHWIWFSKP